MAFHDCLVFQTHIKFWQVNQHAVVLITFVSDMTACVRKFIHIRVVAGSDIYDVLSH